MPPDFDTLRSTMNAAKRTMDDSYSVFVDTPVKYNRLDLLAKIEAYEQAAKAYDKTCKGIEE